MDQLRFEVSSSSSAGTLFGDAPLRCPLRAFIFSATRPSDDWQYHAARESPTPRRRIPTYAMRTLLMTILTALFIVLAILEVVAMRLPPMATAVR